MNSKRFPGKVLSMLGDKPMLQWIWDAANSCLDIDEVIFAIDDYKTASLIESFKGSYAMTSPSCLNGTERLIELKKSGKVNGDIWINWQGDEPFIHQEMIQNLLQSVKEKKYDIYSLKKRINEKHEIEDPNIVKVVTGIDDQALYFSRSPVPYPRETSEKKRGVFYKHIGIYAYTDEALDKIAYLDSTPLELTECLEQLRFLENKLLCQVHTTKYDSIGIDTPDDLDKALKHISSNSQSLQKISLNV